MSDQNDILAAIMQQMSIKTGPDVNPQPLVEVGQPLPRTVTLPKRPPEYHTSGDVFSKSEEKAIRDLLNSPIQFEIEASLGTFRNFKGRNNFHPGLKSLYCFNQTKTFFDRQSRPMGGTLDVRRYYDKIERIEDLHVRKITDMTTEGVTYQTKSRDRKYFVDNTKFGIRISKSSEKHLDDGDEFEREWRKVDKMILRYKKSGSSEEQTGRKNLPDIAIIRYRRRISYTETSRSSKLFGLRFDLTSVDENHVRDDGSIWNIRKYEVEMERIDQSVDLERFIDAVIVLLGYSQDIMCPEQLIDLEERALAIKLHNNIFYGDTTTHKWSSKDQYRLYSGYWNKPKNIKIKDMLDSHFNPAVTIKLNGRRVTMLIDQNGTYLFSPPYDVFKIGEGNDALSGTLVDCEIMLVWDRDRYVVKNLYMFDVLFYKDQDLRQSKFDVRLINVNQIAQNFEDSHLYCGLQCTVKEYFMDGDFYDRTQTAFAKIEADETYKQYNLQDGLIFQPSHWYKNNHTFKWKPEYNLTIDFRIMRFSADEIDYIYKNKKGGSIYDSDTSPAWLTEFYNTPHQDLNAYEGKMYWLLSGAKGKDIPFRGTRSHPFGGFIIVNMDEFDGQSLDSIEIIECKWNYNDQIFEFYRIRDDRDRPNNLETARSVWEDIMNPIPQETIKGETLQLMRKYHNQEKLSILTKEFHRGDVIIDIGSGRGGDLQKWDSIGFDRVFAIEPNEENMAELKRRRHEGQYKAKIVTMPFGAENTHNIKSVIDQYGRKLDGIVSFFSMTFFPQSNEMYTSLLKTIDLLPEGGKFVGAVMDGHKVRDLIEKTREKLSIPEDEPVDYFPGEDEEHSAFTIKQMTEFDDKPVKNKIKIDIHSSSSMVTEQEEWLLYFEHFKRALEKKGFRLISQGYIDKGNMFDLLPEQSKIFSRLNRTFVFQKARVKKTSHPSSIETSTKTSIEPSIEPNVELNIDEIAEFHNLYGEDLYYVGIEIDQSNFIHAILYATSSKYPSMTSAERSEYAQKTRRKIGRQLTQDMFKQLHRGELSRRLQYPYIAKYGEKKAMQISFEEFKKKLLDETVFVGEVSLLELASKFFNIDIYILGENTQPSKLYAEECDDLYGNDKAIVLYTADGLSYHLVAHYDKNYHYTFDTSSSFIRKLNTIVCGGR